MHRCLVLAFVLGPERSVTLLQGCRSRLICIERIKLTREGSSVVQYTASTLIFSRCILELDDLDRRTKRDENAWEPLSGENALHPDKIHAKSPLESYKTGKQSFGVHRRCFAMLDMSDCNCSYVRLHVYLCVLCVVVSFSAVRGPR